MERWCRAVGGQEEGFGLPAEGWWLLAAVLLGHQLGWL